MSRWCVLGFKPESAPVGDQCSKFASASLVRACFNLFLLAFFLLEDLTRLALCDYMSHFLLLDPARVHSDNGLWGFTILSVSLHIPEFSGTTFAQMIQWRRTHTTSFHMQEWKLERHLPWAVAKTNQRIHPRDFLRMEGLRWASGDHIQARIFVK